MKERNQTMSILTGIAIILVVLGHIDWNVLTLFGIFPYYGFHVLIFVFISGYFYKPENENDIPHYVLHKIQTLLIPYFIYNLMYGIISHILAKRGFVFCNEVTVFNFFVEPFLGGHQYGLNFPTWFVPALFILEIINVCVRKLLSYIRLKNDIFFGSVTLIIGIVTVYLAQTGHVWGYLKTPGRILIMFPAFYMGRIYKEYLEKHDKQPSVIYYPVVGFLQVLTYLIAHGSLNFSVVWCTSFASLPFVPFLSTALGIALWLRIARDISTSKLGKALGKVGESSFHIMANHIAIFMIVNVITLFILHLTGNTNLFDMVSFKEDINYVFLLNNVYLWKIVYVIPAIVLPTVAYQCVKNYSRGVKS